MNKVKNAFRIAMSTVLAASVGLAAVGCGDGEEDGPQTYDPETRPLVLSTNAPDKVFNPFFSTSAVDSNILAMTQIGLVSTDKNGTIVCGENEPTAALDYSINETKEGSQTYTTYQFIIKNGIKYSDGVDLTIKDVLFNLYVYLDPVYTGSATMYSTKIVGLNAYRTQNLDVNDDTNIEDFESNFQSEAEQRIDELVDYVYSESRFTTNSERPDISHWSDEKLAQAAEDFKTAGTLFLEELDTDYNAITASMSSYTETNGFTEPWQVFLVNDAGIDLYKHKTPTTLEKDEQGNLIFDPDCENMELYTGYLETYFEEHPLKNTDKNTAEYKTEYDEAVKSWAIEIAYDTYFGQTAKGTYGSQFEIVARYWGTASKLLSQFTAEAKSDYFEENNSVKKISGIEALKGSAFKFSSVSNKSSYSNDYDMLQIRIKGVDPKAIYNFGFSVAPVHYYSGTYNGKNYADVNIDQNQFGLPMGDINFMNEVIKDSAKNGFPIGAGAYQATNSSSADYTESNKLTLADFMSNNVIYFKRNENFTTVGSGLNNAKIKLLRYQVINSDQIINSLNSSNGIDYGEPDATQENLDALGSGVKGVTAWTNGYGYVGINARFVPSVYVRRAIIKAMNTSYITDDYYKGGFAEIIYRSMSTTSWAYPEGATTYTSSDKTSYKYDPSGNEIQKLIDKAADEGGYIKNSQGIYTNGQDTMSYTFTIAGGSTRHPAYKMFLNAAEILNNKCDGINVKVVTSQTALSDLTAGKLQVWAAAWTSTVDPDMYQVYHKDSSAASILNWGYDYIKARKDTTCKDEWKTIVELSKTIDSARSTTDQKTRTAFYKVALDYVMELAVEFPTYQRKDLFAYKSGVINEATLQSGKNLTPYNGPFGRIWEVNYN